MSVRLKAVEELGPMAASSQEAVDALIEAAGGGHELQGEKVHQLLLVRAVPGGKLVMYSISENPQ